jgi:hypothetical protein
MNEQRKTSCHGKANVYQISAKGILENSWSDSVGGMEIVIRQEKGSHVTVLTGELPDQAALSGVLNLLYDLGLELLAVKKAG